MWRDVLLIASALLNVALACLLFVWWAARSFLKALAEDEEDVPGIDRPKFRRHLLVREEDVSGVSGTGVVCEVVEFSDGHAALHWIDSPYPWTTPCPEGVGAIEAIHGHGGKSRVVSIDGPS